jgi:hypothetical protein
MFDSSIVPHLSVQLYHQFQSIPTQSDVSLLKSLIFSDLDTQWGDLPVISGFLEIVAEFRGKQFSFLWRDSRCVAIASSLYIAAT